MGQCSSRCRRRKAPPRWRTLTVGAEELQKKKDAFAKENWDRVDGGQPCSNPLCRCPVCTCGPGCTCNVSTEKVCDDCKAFKKRAEEAAAMGETGRSDDLME
mmetsp:Transcript_20617/g.57771  ORF Transcript_20617/g.57771 Transcript_20617/m.57771 type:complete len:102 (+) Transcript_20617:76-381(+)